ncbi:hypothetical protein Kpol_534p31 [Vanderwaltozyma polyspora DSM 70294]|uniref:Pre-mRNA-processing ATP-dependent RNA helicase PRP5 n=1 Tax=Vanderwaltozyma polyspora (strain ATCC 22028 / DSM 70294 / BCRC 21397 / CBS 2163 / NBRC 10782 / NRRL Y-8283 / UCD 57-17) TaxID=436907 RepID=PRP5_VANPO|nr:uncharacterized protein Kpol_534p31 [Vanderwaltozyma polyspora DSM 70294]A7TJK8.1 RecName: Full=Pre-mRNA-processing ATP-dependent RNA helicase PRP5 [Vanderwaltozyma polyspora DSM 70294]EDO17551.1 hypothetical protein Kpol_534p31 [Vanderwaltozyma polyspora DSM 70294]
MSADNVSSIDPEKERISRERREKLAKWRAKKALMDSQNELKKETVPLEVKNSKITNNENDSTSRSKLLERQHKLQEWKRKKREREEEQLIKEQENTKETSSHSKKKNKKQNRGSQKRQITFDDSDDETTGESKDSFDKSEIVVEKSDMSGSKNNNEDDPLEAYMKSLVNGGQPLNHKIGENILDEDGDDNSIEEDDEFSNSESDEESSRYKRISKAKAKKKVKEIKFTIKDLEPFPKSFYSEPDEVKLMTDDEVEEMRLSLGGIKVKGKHCPKLITRWSQLGLPTDIMNLITKELKYDEPTAIQSQAIPAIMSGRDLIGISKTGSGKTISYILPMLRQIKAQRTLSKNETGPLGLILAPTRELALQINEEVEKFTKQDRSIRTICCTGGSEMKKQINDLKRGVEIVVATPGRLIDILTLNSGKLISTKRITFVVMDEADRLFDMGFEPQITQIMKTVRPDKQCVLFSATFPNKLRSFAARILTDPLTVTINSNNLVNENVNQSFYIEDNENDKFNRLVNILDGFYKVNKNITSNSEEREIDEEVSDKKIIIFVSSQQFCDLLYSKLENFGYFPYTIHAGKPYQERVMNLEKFKTTTNSILLCTEVLSRGLNVPEVSLVIIYNAAKTFAQYVHTTGRTARGTHKGDAITLLLPDELAAAYILKRALRERELSSIDPQMVEDMKQMSERFESGMKEGKYKLSKGFGGKGLDNLDTKREEKQQEEKHKLDKIENDESTPSTSYKTTDNASSSSEVDSVTIPKLEFTIDRDKNIDSTISFTAIVNVNDLPQLVRWEATKNTTLMFIKHETGCSITNKGKYYPEGKGPTSNKDQPKLYLQIEGKEEKDVLLSIELLEQKVREGIKKVEYQSIKSTKY